MSTNAPKFYKTRVPFSLYDTHLSTVRNAKTAFDLPYQYDVFGKGYGKTTPGSGGPSLTTGLLGVANAVLHGNARDVLSAGLGLVSSHWARKSGGRALQPDADVGDVLMFSGCTDKQTSADTSKLTGKGLTTGAMTYALVHAIEAAVASGKATSDLSYVKLLNVMKKTLRSNGLRQTPQFSTLKPFEVSSPFIV